MKRATILAALASLALSGCTGLAMTVGAEAGKAALSERGLDGTAVDLRQRAEILAAYARKDTDLLTNIAVKVMAGEVLLVGTVPDEETHRKAVDRARAVAGIRKIHDFLQIGAGQQVYDFAHDAWINARIRSSFLIDGEIRNVNFTVETVSGRVFLLGIARSPAERQRVVAIARATPYVKKVVDLIKDKQP